MDVTEGAVKLPSARRKYAKRLPRQNTAVDRNIRVIMHSHIPAHEGEKWYLSEINPAKANHFYPSADRRIARQAVIFGAIPVTRVLAEGLNLKTSYISPKELSTVKSGSVECHRPRSTRKATSEECIWQFSARRRRLWWLKAAFT